MQRSALVKNAEEVEGKVEKATRSDGINIYWHDGAEVIPEGWSCIMAHEFFDALAVHSFEVKEAKKENMHHFQKKKKNSSILNCDCCYYY